MNKQFLKLPSHISFYTADEIFQKCIFLSDIELE